MEENQNETVEAPKSARYGLAKLAVGIIVTAVVGKLVDRGIDTIAARRNKTAEETE